MSDQAFDSDLDRGGPRGDFRIGAVIGSSLALFRGHLTHFMALGTILFIPPLVITLAFADLASSALVGTGEDMSTAEAIAGLLYMVLWFAIAAAVTVSAFDALLARAPDFGHSLRRGLARFLPLVGLTVFIILFITIVMGIGAVAVGGIAAVGGTLGAVVAVVLAIALVVLFIWLYLRWSLAVPVVVIERGGVFASLRRSAELSRGHRGKLFGIILLMSVIAIAATIALSFVVVAAAGLSGLAPDAVGALAAIVNYLVQVVVAILFALMVAVAYYELRRIKEGIGVSDIARVFE